MKNIKSFDKEIDYYVALEVSEFASAVELKKSFMRLSLELHPDKQAGKSPAEKEAAKPGARGVMPLSPKFAMLPDSEVLNKLSTAPSGQL